jgi:hypothetical protein
MDVHIVNILFERYARTIRAPRGVVKASYPHLVGSWTLSWVTSGPVEVGNSRRG